MKFCFAVVIASWLLSPSAKADPREDFIKAVVNQCKMDKDKAESLATPGRTGTIVQFTLCINSTVEVGEGCKVACKKPGNNIGS